MPRPLSAREMELFHVALNYAVALDHCNPDVGMGPSRRMIADRIAARLSFDVSEDDLEELSQEIRGS